MNKLTKLATGELIPFYSATVSLDKSSYVWTFNAEISDAQTLDKLKPAKSLRGDYVEVSYKLGLTTWQLIIEDADYNESGNAFSVSGRSKTIFLSEPYSQKITKTWTNRTAQDIINGLCLAAGITLVFNANDWLIDSYAVSERYPIEIISELATEKKLIVLSLPDGTLMVQPNLPCSPNKIADYQPDHYLATDTNLFTRGKKFANNKNYNRVAVTRQSDSLASNAPSVSIEEEQSGEDRLIKVVVSPFVSDINLTHSSGSNVAAYYEGVHYRPVTDQLIIDEGKAQLSKPFSALSSLAWHQDVVGDLVINGKGEIKTSLGFGLVTINYLSPYHQYRFQKLSDIELTAIRLPELTAQPDLGALYVEYVIGAGDNIAPPVVVKTLPTQLDLIDRATQELWAQLSDMDEHRIECAYHNALLIPGRVAQIKINKEARIFNGYIKSVSVQISNTVTQQVTIEHPLL